MNRSRSLAVGAVLALGVTALAGCQPGSGGSGDYAIDGQLSVAITADPGNLHPLLAGGSTDNVSAFVYDSLLYLDPVTSEFHPYLAEEWTESPTAITFTLRDDITCADGTPFTADTVAANFEFIKNPDNASPFFGSVVPADAEISVDGSTLTLEVPDPRPFLLFNAAKMGLVCDAAIEDPDAYTTTSAGTGLFTVTDYVPGDRITLERRDGYNWAPDGTTSDTPGVPEQVVVRIITSASTTANLLQSGELNVSAVSGPDADRLLDGGIDALANEGTTGEIIFNHFDGLPTADADVRVALTQALDLDGLTRILTSDKGQRVKSSMSGGGLACVYDSITGNLPDHDAEGAAALLDDAGWVVGADGVRAKDGQRLAISLVYDNSSDAKSAAAEVVAETWQSLGAEVELTGGDETFVIGATWGATDPTSWTASLGLVIVVYAPSVSHPVWTGPTPPDGINFASMNNESYADLSAEALTTIGDEGCELWRQAEAAQFATADYVPFASQPTHVFLSGVESTEDGVIGIAGPGGWSYRVLAD